MNTLVKAFNKNDPRHKTNNIFGGAEPIPDQKENKSTPPPTETPKVASVQATPPPESQTTSQQEVKPIGVSFLIFLCIS